MDVSELQSELAEVKARNRELETENAELLNRFSEAFKENRALLAVLAAIREKERERLARPPPAIVRLRTPFGPLPGLIEFQDFIDMLAKEIEVPIEIPSGDLRKETVPRNRLIELPATATALEQLVAALAQINPLAGKSPHDPQQMVVFVIAPIPEAEIRGPLKEKIVITSRRQAAERGELHPVFDAPF